MPSLKKNSKGQGFVEYIILITLMGVALVATIRVLSLRTDTKFNNAATTIQNL